MNTSYGASLIPQIVSKLFAKDEQRINEMLEKLIEEHHALTGHPNGFLYMGTFWSMIPLRYRKTSQKTFLHKSLHPKGNELYEADRTLKSEKTLITHGLGFLLRDAKDPQDVRDILPDTAMVVLPDLGSLPRTRPEAYHIREKALTMHTYDKISEIFDFYAANQLIY